MSFSQGCSIATQLTNNLKSFYNENLFVTATFAHDPNHVYNYLKKSLLIMEKKENGSQDDLDSLQPQLSWLPTTSEQLFEINILIQSLKKNWGLLETMNTTKKVLEEPQIELTIDNVESIMINMYHVEFINLGNEGRKWIVNQLSTLNKHSFYSEENLVSNVECQIHILKELIHTAKTSMNYEEVMTVFYNLQCMKYGESIPGCNELLIDRWINHSRKDLFTLAQIKEKLDQLYKVELENGYTISTIINKYDLKKIVSDYIA